jgi:hypothetical protein
MTQESKTDARFDYAWKWFEFHARQRTTMFNFFLIATGVVANGIFTLIAKDHAALAASVSFIGAFLSIGFIFLDHRNQTLLQYGRDVLQHLEHTEIFDWDQKVSGKKAPLALLYREFEAGIPCRIAQHSIWIPIIQIVACIGFLLLGVYSLKH